MIEIANKYNQTVNSIMNTTDKLAIVTNLSPNILVDFGHSNSLSGV